MPLLLLSKSNPLRWASIWFWVQTWILGHLYCCDIPRRGKGAQRSFRYLAETERMGLYLDDAAARLKKIFPTPEWIPDRQPY